MRTPSHLLSSRSKSALANMTILLVLAATLFAVFTAFQPTLNTEDPGNDTDQPVNDTNTSNETGLNQSNSFDNQSKQCLDTSQVNTSCKQEDNQTNLNQSK